MQNKILNPAIAVDVAKSIEPQLWLNQTGFKLSRLDKQSSGDSSPATADDVTFGQLGTPLQTKRAGMQTPRSPGHANSQPSPEVDSSCAGATATKKQDH